nr:hypothetical protein [Tanacetum cinerariifolium]
MSHPITIPISFGQLTKLYFLDASYNSLQGVVSEARFANLSALKYLNTAYNDQLTFNVSRDWIPPSFISLESCIISDEFPQWFQTQQNLRELVLSNTSISGPLPTWLRWMPIIRVLDLSYIKLTRTLTNLPSGDLLNGVGYQAEDILLMQNNLFTGSILTLLCTRTDLTILNLSSNRLTGNIPECLGNLRSLMKILVGSYKLSGSLPSSLGHISSSLTWLQLNENNFSGEFLTNIGTSYFWVSWIWVRTKSQEKYLNGLEKSYIVGANELTGRIPPSIAILNFLRHLNLSHNNLSGQIPTGKQLQTLTDPSIYARNRHLCGAPFPKNCSNHENPPTITSRNKSEDASKPKNLWFYLDIMSGFATGFWGIIGVLFFKKQWRHKLFMISEVTIERIHVAVAVRVSKIRRGNEVV